MAFEFVARNGVIALNNSTVTGSLNVTAGITGSLLGTASFATTASFALNAGGAAAASNLIFSGSVTASVDVGTTTFRLISGSSTFLFVWAMAWYCYYLPSFNINLFNWSIIVLLGFEIIYIAIQAARGQCFGQTNGSKSIGGNKHP